MITVLNKPQQFTTLNRAYFRVTSDNAAILQFSVQIIDPVTGLLITQSKYATLPMLPSGTVFDLAPLLASFIDSQIVNSTNITELVSKTMRPYSVSITELYRDGAGDVVPGVTINLADNFYIFNSLLSRIDFNSYSPEQYVLTAGSVGTMFLNKRPLTSKITSSSIQYLYLNSNAPANIVIKFYNNKAGLIGSHTIANEITAGNAYRLNISPAVLSLTFGAATFNLAGDEFTDQFTSQFGSVVTFGECDYYTVQLFTPGGAALSELRTFVLEDDICGRDYVDILFVNSLGGVDTMRYNNPKESISSKKTTIDANTLQLDDEGNYQDYTNGVYTPSEVVINSVNESTFSVVSDILTDPMAKFLKSIIESDKAYIRLSSGDIYPISIVSQSYIIARKKYATTNTRHSLQFKIDDTDFNL